MMEAYLEITLLAGDDIGHHFLWEKVFQQVHIALVENKNSEGRSLFGVTFPEFNGDKSQLGRKLRLFSGNRALLEQLDMACWFNRLADYVHITSVRQVPDNIAGYACFYRPDTKTSQVRLARRAAKRHNISFEQAMEERAGFQPEYIHAPFIWTNSQSRQARFRLYIMQRLAEKPDDGAPLFSCYGLARKAWLPHF